MDKPQRIVERPKKVKNRNNRKELSILCDNGQRYNVPELSAASGLSTSTIYHRLHNEGWDNQSFFRPAVKGIPPVVSYPDITARTGVEVKDFEEDDLSFLDNKPRGHNMVKLPKVTPIERQMMAEGVL